MTNKDPGGVGSTAAIISSFILGGSFVLGMERSVKPGLDGLAKMADALVASKPAIVAAGQGVGAVGRSVSTLTAILTRPWHTHLLPWRR